MSATQPKYRGSQSSVFSSGNSRTTAPLTTAYICAKLLVLLKSCNLFVVAASTRARFGPPSLAGIMEKQSAMRFLSLLFGSCARGSGATQLMLKKTRNTDF
eukprot:512860-Amphidinium_carterae.1